MTAAVSFTRNAAVRRLVQRLAPDADHLLRDVLAVVDERGNLRPDDLATYELPMIETMGGAPRGISAAEPSWLSRPTVSTAPDALRNLPPVVVPPKPVSKPKPAPKPRAKTKPKPKPKPRTAKAKPAPRPRRVVECGTPGGYKRHLRPPRTPICVPCRDARREYERDLYARRNAGRTPKKKAHAPCGTPGGARYHRRHHTPLCDPCSEAERAASRRRYHAKKGNPT